VNHFFEALIVHDRADVGWEFIASSVREHLG
jgi:hypothetical protein